MEVNIYSAILRLIKTRQDDVKSVIIDGNVESWDKYQYLVGQLTSLRKLDSDIRDLFRKWEVDDEVDNGADNAQRKKIVGIKPAEKKEEDKKSDLSKVPKPTGWRLVVLPYKGVGKTKGGVLLTDKAVEDQQVASVCALVLEVGPDAYADKDKFPHGPWCKKGDWVIIARYAGSRIKIEGGELRILNDDEILGTVESPEDILGVYT